MLPSSGQSESNQLYLYSVISEHYISTMFLQAIVPTESKLLYLKSEKGGKSAL